MTERNILAGTYTDTCDIYELIEYKDGSVTKSDWRIVSPGVPCALSQTKNSAPKQAEYNALNNLYTIFMSDLQEVKAGSRIVCRGYALICGKPFIYNGSHQEIPCVQNEKA